MKAITFISEPKDGHTNGSTSYPGLPTSFLLRTAMHSTQLRRRARVSRVSERAAREAGRNAVLVVDEELHG